MSYKKVCITKNDAGQFNLTEERQEGLQLW